MPVTITGCLLPLAMAIALPFALKWPRQTRWLKSTSVGQACALFFVNCVLQGMDRDAVHMPPSWKERAEIWPELQVAQSSKHLKAFWFLSAVQHDLVHQSERAAIITAS